MIMRNTIDINWWTMFTVAKKCNQHVGISCISV